MMLGKFTQNVSVEQKLGATRLGHRQTQEGVSLVAPEIGYLSLLIFFLFSLFQYAIDIKF